MLRRSRFRLCVLGVCLHHGPSPGEQAWEDDGDILPRFEDDAALIADDLAVAVDLDADVIDVFLPRCEDRRHEGARAGRGVDALALDEQLAPLGDLDTDPGAGLLAKLQLLVFL